MGTWGSGLLDGDGPLDTVGEITNWVEEQAAALASEKPRAEAAGRLGGAVGLLLQFSPFCFEDRERASRLRSAILIQQSALDALGQEARRLVVRVLAGDGVKLAARKGRRKGELLQALGGYLDGVQEPSLFEHPAARSLVQEVAERCVNIVDAELSASGVDLYSVDTMGLVALLLLLPQCRVDLPRFERWRERMRAIYQTTAEQTDTAEDLPFFTEFMENLELAFELAIERFGGGPGAPLPAPFIAEPVRAPPGAALDYEGFRFGSPIDVYDALKSKRTVGRDWYYWDWTVRFCAEHPDRAGWVDAALEGLIAETMAGGLFRLTKKSIELLEIASKCGRTSLASVLVPTLQSDLTEWNNGKVDQLLHLFHELRPAALDEETIEALLKLGRRKNCFGGALAVLSFVDPPRAAKFIGDGLLNALELKTKSAMEHAVTFYFTDQMAPHRAEIVATLKTVLPAKRLKALRKRVRKEAEDFGDEELLVEFEALLAK